MARELEAPDIWNDPERAQALGRERAQLEGTVNTIDRLTRALGDSEELLEMAGSEDDESMLEEVAGDLDKAEAELAQLEFRRMFSGAMDPNNAYLDIQAGSGGTEAQDWADMLLRMYLRWGELHGFKTELMEVSEGEVAGIKSATIRYEGAYAFGWLRTEIGVHRLVDRLAEEIWRQLRHPAVEPVGRILRGQQPRVAVRPGARRSRHLGGHHRLAGPGDPGDHQRAGPVLVEQRVVEIVAGRERLGAFAQQLQQLRERRREHA